MSKLWSWVITYGIIFSLQIILCQIWLVHDSIAYSPDISPGNAAVIISDKRPELQQFDQSKSDTTGAENKSDIPLIVSPTTENTESEKKLEDDEAEKNNMESVLELLDHSQEVWAKGDIEAALEFLDQAYALILDANGSQDIARQKDDLRLLISKKILAVYSAMQTATNGKRSEIPLIFNDDVEKEIKTFQTKERDFFIRSYKNSTIYRPIIIRELEKAGLPEELSWLPLVESGFKVTALSRARALGPWQFIPSTGYKYNLERSEWIDERMDIEKSTRAAIDYLKELHQMFGDWLTVLAAYNCGEGRVLKVISGQHLNYLDRFWDLYHQLPYETARYVPRFLATLHIIKNPEKYGMDLSLSEGEKMTYIYETVNTDKPMQLKDIAKHLDTSEDILTMLNAELRYKATPDKPYDLKVPLAMAEKFAQIEDQIPIWKRNPKTRSIVIRHRVKKGETLSSIAIKYKTSIKAVAAYNRINDFKALRVGRRIYVPVRGYQNVHSISQQQSSNSGSEYINYIVRKGDTLSSIAKRFGTSVSDIKTMNQLKGTNIRSGETLKINNLN